MPNYYSKTKYSTHQNIIDGFLADQERWFTRAQQAVPNLPQEKTELLRCAFGHEASTNELLGSNGVERAEIMHRLALAMNDHKQAMNHTFAKIRIANTEWSASRQNPIIDLVDIRLAATVLKKLGHSSIATIRFGCMPTGKTGSSFRFHALVDALVFDDDVSRTVPIAAAASQRRYLAPQHVASPITLTYPKGSDERVTAAAAASLLDMGDPLVATAKSGLEAEKVEAWSVTSAQRALDRLKLLSLCRLDRLLIATGSFEPVLASLRAGAQSRVRKQYQRGLKSLHPDALLHFWADPLLRDPDEPLSLPFIKQRK